MNKLQIFFSNQIILLISIIILSIPAILPLTKPGFFPTQDFIHVARLYEMSKSIKDGQFPVRWVPDFRYGEPLFNFYAPLPFYLGSLIHDLNFSLLATTKILLGLGIIVSGIAMFFLGKTLFNNLGGMIAAILYIYAPYHSVDVYVRGAMSESLALIFFPVIFLFAYKLSQKINSTNIILLSCALAGLFFTHNIMTVLFFPFFVGWMIFLVWSTKNFKVLKYLTFSTLLGVGLAASFLLPAFLEKDLVQSSKIITGYFDYRGHFVEIKQFFSTFWGYGASLWGGRDDMSFQVGLTHWAALFLSLLTSFVFRKDRKKLSLVLVLIAAFVFSLFMQHNKSTPIWLRFPILAYTQFPWRFLGISIFFVSLIGGMLGVYLQKRLIYLGFVLVLAVIWLNIVYFKPESYYLDSIDDHYASSKVLLQDDKLPKDYLPIWVLSVQRERVSLPHAVLGDALVSNYQTKSSAALFNIKTFIDSDIEVPVTFFPGWKVWANNQPIDLETPDKYGLIRFKLPPGEFSIKMQFTDTPIRTVGNLISGFSSMIIAWFLIRRKFSD